jgi:hypothetical protein
VGPCVPPCQTYCVRLHVEPTQEVCHDAPLHAILCCQCPLRKIVSSCACGALQERFLKFHASCLEHLTDSPSGPECRRLRDSVIKLIATYMPYYLPPEQVLNGLLSLPPLSHAWHHQQNVPDYMVKEFSQKLGHIPSVCGLLRYLDGLEPVARSLGSWALLSETAKARLQNQLYFLSLPGGPRCVFMDATATVQPSI